MTYTAYGGLAASIYTDAVQGERMHPEAWEASKVGMHCLGQLGHWLWRRERLSKGVVKTCGHLSLIKVLLSCSSHCRL
jgi:hypothetical protein